MRMYLWWEMQLKMSADQEHDIRRALRGGDMGYSQWWPWIRVVATRCRNFVYWCTFSALHLTANI